MIRIQRETAVPDFFDNAILRFIVKSGSNERTVSSVKIQIKDILEQNVGRLWTFRENDEIVGFTYVEMVGSYTKNTVCIVHALYIENGNRKFLKMVDDLLTRWAASNGATEGVFFTRRNEYAFIRKLGSEWEVDSVVLKKKIEVPTYNNKEIR